MSKIQQYVMKREEVPECWLPATIITPADIASHLIDEVLACEIDPEELQQ